MIRKFAIGRSALLLGFACAVGVGCQGLNIFAPHPRPGEGQVAKEERGSQLPGKPSRYSFRVAPYVFLADYEVNRDQPLFRDLAGLRDQVYRELHLPPSDRPVFVHLFEDKERYEHFMQRWYPQLPKRRAFFIAEPRGIGEDDLLVFTYRSERIQQDLRHELTHALLHSVLKEVPLWLDEGLAEYFELPPRNLGVNDAHLNHIRRSQTEPFRPDLARLEKLEEVRDMSPAEYREAWAWTHYFLRGSTAARGVLLAYLQQLKHTPKPGQLRPKLAQAVPSPEDALRGHMASVAYAQR